jgi:hypothetical protein
MTKKDEKNRRLAEALRANLRKRKEAGRNGEADAASRPDSTDQASGAASS